MRQVTVLGATGSIGASSLDVIGRHPDRLRARTLVAGSNVEALLALCRTHQPDHAALADERCFVALREGLRDAGLATQAHAGMDAICALAAEEASDTVVAAIVGAAGLDSTLAAARAGKRILLANKESLVMAGDLLMQAARLGGACIVPVDSEHNAILQCLPPGAATGATGTAADTVQRIVLTASGGPFRGRGIAELATVTAAQAIAHPNWSMGPKISVDSATLMNKGLEVIEAHHLFGRPVEGFEVLVHPQSLVHSLVEFVDGSTLAQLGLPDMRTAIAIGFAWPDRVSSGVGRLDLLAHGRLDFEAADDAAFPCLPLAFAALAEGGTAPAVLNASNEVAVAAFLQGRIGFLAIPALVADTLAAVHGGTAASLGELRDIDTRARRHAASVLERHAA